MGKERVKKPHNKKRALKKTLKIGFVGIALIALAVIFTIFFIGLGIYTKYSREFAAIKPQSNTTQLIMYDKDGKEFFRGFGAAEPKRIALNDIPDVVKQATLAAEDADFYKHGPVDFKSIARSIYDNWQSSDKKGLSKVEDLLKEDSYVQGGGSTITQQLVKNIYLNPQKSWERKLKEVIFSYNLERKYTKDQILEKYLNEIYYGQQAIGIQNAAHTYFNKDVHELTLAEASMLAGLPQAPSYYDPMGDNFDLAKKRQEYVLQKMLLGGNVDLESAKQAANAPLDFYGETLTVDKYPFFAQYVKDELVKKLGLENVDNSGYKVYTTLDVDKQELAETQIKNWLQKLSYRGATNSAAVIEDPKTGELLAMVGGVDWNKSKVNVATSERQPGSSFKPIVYATAFENGYTAATILVDKLVNFGGIPPYMPRNYNGGFSGYLTVRKALARSLNVPAVEMGKMVGIDKVIDMAHNLGITTINKDASNYGLSLSLGSGEVKLVDMVSVYSTFANEGSRIPQTSIKRIVDEKGNDIALPKRKEQNIISKESAFILSSILSDNTARSVTFGNNSPLKTDKTTAVKTGTTDNYADSWTLGYSPSLVVGVWMGNNDRTPMKRVSGVEGAAYIWHDIITESLKNSPNESFVKPEEVVQSWINPSTGALASRPGKPNILEYFKVGTVPAIKMSLSYLRQF